MPDAAESSGVRFVRAAAILFALALLVLPAPASADTLARPSWTVGDAWTYGTNTTLTPGLNLTGTVTWTVQGTVQAMVGGQGVNAYRVVLAGSGTASGNVTVSNTTGPVKGDWILTGEERFEPTDLHVIYSLLDLSVNGTYQNLIPFVIRVQNTTTFDIVADTWRYPLPVGGSGGLQVTYSYMQDFYGPVGMSYHENGTGGATFGFSLGGPQTVATPAGSFSAYPSDETWPHGSLIRSWYSPQTGNAVRTETFDAGGNLTAVSTLHAYRYQALEAPTFLGLTLLEWAIVVAAVAAGGALVAWRQLRRRKARRPPEGGSPPAVTSGPRGP